MKRHTVKLTDTVDRLQSTDAEPGVYYDELLDRIETMDEQLHSFIDEPDRASRIDRAVTQTRQRWERRNTRPPLYGVNVGVKDIFHVDGLPTRAGSKLPASVLSGPEATVVTTLRNAGAIVLGKTVTTEFAYSPVGPTRNPHDLNHTPGGSSSGSAAAVAAGLCPLALGTQTVGSIIRPAAFCGVVGFKPSRGRISTEGVIPFSSSADQVGLFTQNVAGARYASAVLCEEWTHREYRQKPTLGVVTGAYLEQATDLGIRRFNSQVGLLERAGYEVRHLDLFDDINQINEQHDSMINAEAALAHAEWFTEHGEKYHPETAKMIRSGWETDLQTVGEGRKSQRKLQCHIRDALDQKEIDLLLSPAAPGPAPEGLENSGDPVMNLPWTHAGVPAVTIPAEKTTEGLPIGLQCVAKHTDDEVLLAWAERLFGELSSNQ